MASSNQPPQATTGVEQPQTETEVHAGNTPSDQPAPPPGFIVHTESTTSILFAAPPETESVAPAPVFLNPVQEYNRDLSVAAIRTWSEMRQKAKAAYWEQGIRRKWERRRKREVEGGQEPVESKRRKLESTKESETGQAETHGSADDVEEAGAASQTTTEKQEPVLTPPTFRFTLLEALSATGLRAIRYAKEIPLLRYVVANDLSSSAVADIRRNIEYNGLSPKGLPSTTTVSQEGQINEKQDDATSRQPTLSKLDIEDLTLGKVRANEGDACVKMYNHRAEKLRFDVVDLDPYGSAVPFLDAAIGAVADGGLMCITCTDVGVLAGHNYPEKAFTHYGGVCVNSEYSHEVALRLVLHSLATTAARYGRHIEPLLSLSIDFYVRLFIKIDTAPIEVKALPSKTSLVYYCSNCQTPFLQPFGRVNERKSAKTGNTNYTYHAPAGPPPGVGERCSECGGKFHIGGPMWSGPLHNNDFVSEMLSTVREHGSKFKTAPRIEGMLTVAHNELEEPFYFTPARMAKLFNATSPALSTFGSALLNAGYKISRSHASSGSIKTDAPRTFVHDVIREWIKQNPVVMKNVKDGSPSKVLLDKPQTHKVDLTPHPAVDQHLLSSTKLIKYQQNPQANWGPARAAVKGVPKGKSTTKIVAQTDQKTSGAPVA